MKVTFGI